ncbi:MAG: cyclophane-forming radical SAM/SPASM peptide maturase GrrM/OscB [Gammaproteobacteria bacterium]
MIANKFGQVVSFSGEVDENFRAGPIELIGIQPTLFCNLNCSYCFLSEEDRRSPKKITIELVDKIAERVFESGLVDGVFTITWAASEPLTLTPEFYEEAFATIEKHNTNKTKIVHSFTTNATLITEKWCEFFSKYQIYLAVSLDGPAFIHDRCRVTRTGKGTHKKVIEGVRLLRKHNFPFACISVISDYTLDYPDEFYDFFRSLKIGGTALNFDEADGVNSASSMDSDDSINRYERFLSRLYDIVRNDGSKFWIREINQDKSFYSHEEISDMKLHGKRGMYLPNNQCVIPFAVLNIDCQGNFSTFTPELLATKHHEYGNFYFGRIQDDSIESVIHTKKFQDVWREIAAGVRKCYETCPEFAFCGGGSPSNKYVENATFDCTETLHCKICIKSRTKIIQEKLFGGPQMLADTNL